MQLGIVALALVISCFAVACGGRDCSNIYEPSEAAGTFSLPVSASALDGATVTVCRGTSCSTATMKADSSGAGGSQDPLDCSAISTDGGSELDVHYTITNTPADVEVFTVSVLLQNGVNPVLSWTANVLFQKRGSSDCGYSYTGALD